MADRFTHTIDPETFAVTIYDNTLENPTIPAIFQAHHPDANGEPFSSVEDAEAWVSEFYGHDHPVSIEQPDTPAEPPTPLGYITTETPVEETPAGTPTTPSK